MAVTHGRPVRPLPRRGLGALILAAREKRAMTLRSLSRALGVSHAHVSDVRYSSGSFTHTQRVYVRD